MKKIIVYLLLVNVFSFCSYADSTSKVYNKKEKQRISRISELLEKRIVPINFYGIVVDQNDNPVEKAEVEYTIEAITLEDYIAFQMGRDVGGKKYKVKTDKNGLFKINTKGTELYIKDIKKEGYEFMEEWNKKDSFNYLERGDYKKFMPDKNNPFEFRLRKRGEVVYLVKNVRSISLSENESYIGVKYNLMPHWINEDYKLFENRPSRSDDEFKESEQRGEKFDLLINMGRFVDEDIYKVNFIALDPNGGLILSDELLYDAPMEGYLPEVNLVLDIVPSGRAVEHDTKYLYIRSGKNAIFSRINLEISNYPLRLLINLDSYTNPTGSRNLEFDSAWNTKEFLRRNEERKKKLKKEWEERKAKAKEERRVGSF